MKKKISSILALVLVLIGAYFGFFDGGEITELPPEEPQIGIQQTAEELPEEAPEEDTLIYVGGSYTTKDDVALYIHTYGCLPENFMTKKEAQALGWEGGGLDPYAEGMCIGGDRFGNYEGLLPDAEGRTWTECDIDTLGASSRGAKRIVFSNDGLIYYTGDHYESFELLYGEP
ncbi:MAG: ribonuclease [Oscillospiraceae bacterium]|nr:ribonuclease [Oscillospiraceae bacterium]